jgi:hypothetical protein
MPAPREERMIQLLKRLVLEYRRSAAGPSAAVASRS